MHERGVHQGPREVPTQGLGYHPSRCPHSLGLDSPCFTPFPPIFAAAILTPLLYSNLNGWSRSWGQIVHYVMRRSTTTLEFEDIEY